MQRSYRSLVALAVVLMPAGGFAADPSREEILRGIGEAVAAAEAISFHGVVVVATATVSAAGEAEWENKVENALSLLYAPPDGSVQKIEYSRLRGSSRLEMTRQRTPGQVVRELIAPGRTVLTIRWSIGAAAELETFAIFDGDTLLFDTLLSMPIIRAPILSVPHL